MSSERDVTPEKHWNTGRYLALFGCLVAIGTNVGISIYSIMNEARFPVGMIIPFLGSLFCTWAVIFYKTPVDKRKGAPAKNV